MGQLLIVTTHTSPIPWQNYTDKAVRELNVLHGFYSNLISFYGGTRKGNPQKIYLVPWFFVLLDIQFETAEEPRLQPEGDCHQKSCSDRHSRFTTSNKRIFQLTDTQITKTLQTKTVPNTNNSLICIGSCLCDHIGITFLDFQLFSMNLESKVCRSDLQSWALEGSSSHPNEPR